MKIKTLIAFIPKESNCLLEKRQSPGYVCWECAWRSDREQCDELRGEK